MIHEGLESALFSIPPDDRVVWLRVGMALRSEYGEEGWPLWNEWSSGWPKYKERDCKTAWRSFRVASGITIGTLYWIARDHGWSGETHRVEVSPEYRRKAAEDLRRAEALERQTADSVSAQADAMMRQCTVGWSTYLVNKGFPKKEALLYTGGVRFEGERGPFVRQFVNALFLPIRDLATNEVRSAELIDDTGKKLFLPGGRFRGCGVRLTTGARTVLAEGYATALSIAQAFGEMQISATVIATMSSSNMPNVAAKYPPWLVVADNDPHGVGLKYAKLCNSQRIWMPDEDKDANDLHKRKGLQGLMSALRQGFRAVA